MFLGIITMKFLGIIKFLGISLVSFSFIMVYLKLNGAFWANCTIIKKKIRLNK
jgi:hypothetical protein